MKLREWRRLIRPCLPDHRSPPSSLLEHAEVPRKLQSFLQGHLTHGYTQPAPSPWVASPSTLLSDACRLRSVCRRARQTYDRPSLNDRSDKAELGLTHGFTIPSSTPYTHSYCPEDLAEPLTGREQSCVIMGCRLMSLCG